MVVLNTGIEKREHTFSWSTFLKINKPLKTLTNIEPIIRYMKKDSIKLSWLFQTSLFKE